VKHQHELARLRPPPKQRTHQAGRQVDDRGRTRWYAGPEPDRVPPGSDGSDLPESETLHRLRYDGLDNDLTVAMDAP
jgi:hypothetical protein